MRARATFSVCVDFDINKKDYNRLIKQMERTLGTSLDIDVGEVSWLDKKTDDYVYTEAECNFTQLKKLEEV